MKATFFASVAEFRAWLGKGHASETELLVGFHRKASGRGITYPEALDEALAFGWIDGVRRRIDDNSYSIRFTPRGPGSVWSAKNVQRVRELIAEGRMQPPGLRAFEQRDEGKTQRLSHEREHSALDAGFDAKLRSNRKAGAFFDAQPPGYRKLMAFWIMSAKKEETRLRRLEQLMERSAKGMRIDLLKPGRPTPS